MFSNSCVFFLKRTTFYTCAPGKHDRYVGIHSINIWNGSCLRMGLILAFTICIRYYHAADLFWSPLVITCCYNDANTTGKSDGVIEREIFRNLMDVIERTILPAPLDPSTLYIDMTKGHLVPKNSYFLPFQLLRQGFFHIA